MLHIDILIRSKFKLNVLTYTNSDKYACVDVIVNVCALMLMINLGVGVAVGACIYGRIIYLYLYSQF